MSYLPRTLVIIVSKIPGACPMKFPLQFPSYLFLSNFLLLLDLVYLAKQAASTGRLGTSYSTSLSTKASKVSSLIYSIVRRRPKPAKLSASNHILPLALKNFLTQ
jgi:hypothetical protein